MHENEFISLSKKASSPNPIKDRRRPQEPRRLYQALPPVPAVKIRNQTQVIQQLYSEYRQKASNARRNYDLVQKQQSRTLGKKSVKAWNRYVAELLKSLEEEKHRSFDYLPTENSGTLPGMNGNQEVEQDPKVIITAMIRPWHEKVEEAEEQTSSQLGSTYSLFSCQGL